MKCYKDEYYRAGTEPLAVKIRGGTVSVQEPGINPRNVDLQFLALASRFSQHSSPCKIFIVLAKQQLGANS